MVACFTDGGRFLSGEEVKSFVPFSRDRSPVLLEVGFSPESDCVGCRGRPSTTVTLTQGPFHFGGGNRLLTAGIKGHRGVLVLSAAEEKMLC